MVSHLTNEARRALLRAYCIGPRRILAQRQPSLRRVVQPSTPFSSSALAIATTARTIQPTQPRRWRGNAASRSYATVSNPEVPKDIAVLGGGLTGLTTAYYLTRFHPEAKITLYESDGRLGGWIDTEKVEVETSEGEFETVSFERGARAVAPQSALARWEDFVLFDLIDQLNLIDEADALPRNNEVIKNRYIYYPDHLVRVPGNLPKSLLGRLGWAARVLYQFLTEPVFEGVFPSIKSMLAASTKESAEGRRRAIEDRGKPAEPSTKYAIADIQDLSTGDYFKSVFGRPDLINNMLSALVHGIWGGDVWKLSMLEGTFAQALIQQQHPGEILLPVRDHDIFSCRDVAIRNEEVFNLATHFGPHIGYIGFRDGFSTLTDALTHALWNNPNVTIRTNTPVSSIRYEQGKAIVSSSTGAEGTSPAETSHDKVISSLYSGTLAKLTGDALPTLKNHSSAVTIQIVNLWYPNQYLNSRHPGFGYLIPQSVPAKQNPHAALGVIFDSDREAAADSPERQSAPGTKLTVMLGGHYWDYLDPESWPDAKEATAMAIDTVQRQLGIPATEPVFTGTKICRECIPQHLVGHRETMAQAHNELYEAFRGTLAVVGGSYTAPGVLPSLKAARDVALKVSGQGYKLKDGTEYNMTHVGETGLGRFVGRNETYRLWNRKRLPYRYGNTKGMFDDESTGTA
ncbi:Protoporphyrinogen oxidase [Cytospora mali]|uniref:Protoporphyrinogen oxidase n=1 Tax=Cytospora mali TaxID=578113 RepID=A0A194UQR3_CYTMA|nr:Protoporphyrinogen oxidase [Valsa mali var. pyri (nom. inval.)]